MPCRVTNSLILNFWAINEDAVGSSGGYDLLRYMFSQCPEVNYVFWVCSATTNPPSFLERNFTKVNLSKRTVKEEEDVLKKSAVYFLHRSKVLPQLQVRDARVEDNDDLLPILQSSNPNVANGQEEYFLANLIQSQDDQNKFFVGVHKNRPVGMLATSLNINSELLARVFSLEKYTGLISYPDVVINTRPHVTLLVGEPQAVQYLNLSRIADESMCNWIDGAQIRQSDSNLQVSSNFASAVASKIKLLADKKSQSRGCFVTDFPRNEHDARALLHYLREEKIVVDAVIEVQGVEEDIDLEAEEDIAGEYLDAIEILREPFTSADVPHDDFFNYNVTWKKIKLEESVASPEIANDLVLVELKSLLDGYEKEAEALVKSNQAGPSTNAFAISLFSMDEKFESRSEDLLRVAFEEYEGIDYCILMVPNATIPSSALTHGMQCPRVREGVSFDQSLYIIHRQALLAHDFLSVVRLEDSHIELLGGLVTTLDEDDGSDLLATATRSLRDKEVNLANNPAEVCFSVVIGNDVVGVVCLSRKLTTSEDITHFRENYLLDDIISYERHRGRAQAMITHWVINPIYSKWSRFILREVMRYYHKTLLYFHGAKQTRPCSEMLEEMIPVRVRSVVYAKPADMFESKDCSAGYYPACDRPLYVMMKKDIVHRKNVIGKRVVVVGGNSTALSILEQICMNDSRYVNNVYLVMESPPTPWRSSTAENEFDESSDVADNYSGALSPKDIDDYTEQELFALGLANRITLIQGKLSDIDRKNQAIIVSDEVIVEYDVLVVASGLQDVTYKKIPSLSSLHPISCSDKGIFCLGSYHVDMMAINHLRKEGEYPTNKSCSDRIVVYGKGIKALCALGRLEELGIPASRIVWVNPEEGVSEIENEEMNKIATTGLKFSTDDEEESPGTITIYWNSQILDVDYPSHDELIAEGGTGVIDGLSIRKYPPKNSVMGPKDEFLECSTLILCADLQCDVDVFTAINESGLVYDGGVVVDENFRTVDPCIYAVGAFSRYSRRFTDQVSHSRINSRELGEYVASEIITKHFTSESISDDAEFRHNDTLKPPSLTRPKFHKFHRPKIIDCRFPGNVQYFYSSVPDNVPNTKNGYLITGPAVDLSSRVCGVKIAPLGYVSEITCCQLLHPATSAYHRNLAKYIGCLVGWHESYLNSAAFAFESNSVPDWIDFFSGDWVTCLRFDRFPALAEMIRVSLYSDRGMITIMDKVMENAESTALVDVIASARRNILGDRAANVDANTKNVVVAQLLDFIRKNKAYLPKYFLPNPKSSKSS
eukprot:CAMPEP_0185043622 /NCGR_PEP_ID=MMETSP1103-20130426/43004_1 /TAXON_ID=36769 /ORGANISM="Paraphysomonas bandaiensis, Strain Caron Lab Isolate" /LENGTH=1284 /DNA_ID=CAMNT_0027583819 /DNA_START=406 /DNA_END=4260 /DNA_ORIENTATION=+